MAGSERSPRWQKGALRNWHCLLHLGKPQPAQQPQALQVLLWSYNSASQLSTISSCAWGGGQGEKGIKARKKPPRLQAHSSEQFCSQAEPTTSRLLLFQSALWPHWQSMLRAQAALGQWLLSSSDAAQATPAARQIPALCLWCLWILRSSAFESHTQPNQCFNSAGKEPL